MIVVIAMGELMVSSSYGIVCCDGKHDGDAQAGSWRNQVSHQKFAHRRAQNQPFSVSQFLFDLNLFASMLQVVELATDSEKKRAKEISRPTNGGSKHEDSK